MPACRSAGRPAFLEVVAVAFAGVDLVTFAGPIGERAVVGDR
jgi:hypothetical protein